MMLPWFPSSQEVCYISPDSCHKQKKKLSANQSKEPLWAQVYDFENLVI